MRSFLVPAAVAAALFAAGPAGAAQYPFGADLENLPANNEPAANCQHAPPGRDGFGPNGSQSCMYSYINTYPDTLVPPATGTVSTIRVKVGTTTGRMRVNVIRFLFHQNGTNTPDSSGPYLESYGPEFTPAANAITPLATNLPVREDPTPAPSDHESIQVIDALALEVEDPNVPIPIFPDNNALVYPVYPGPTESGTPAPSPNALPSYTYVGIGVLMNGVLTVPDGNPPPPAPTQPTTPLPAAQPAVAAGATSAHVRRGAATVPLKCKGADCKGALTLQSLAGAAAKKKKTTYGHSTFSVKAGTTGKVRVKLNSRGRALLKHHLKAKVLAKVTLGSGAAAKSFKLTLKR